MGKCIPTEYAVSKGVKTSKSVQLNGKPTCKWWLQTPGNWSNLAIAVGEDGSYQYPNYDSKNIGENTTNTNIGVRPALWISLES